MNEQITLQELRKRKFATIKDFAAAYGCSYSTACHLLNGKHHMTLTRQDVQRLADLFGASFDECIEAANNSFKQAYPDRDPTMWMLEARWRWQEQIRDQPHEWASGKRDHPLRDLLSLDCFNALGLDSNATEQDIKIAFREKVKASADGKGGYAGDMDKLTQAKEQALNYVRRIG